MSRVHRIRPQVLLLEDRALPSCLVYVQQDTLVIRGDDHGNTIRVDAQGSRVSVRCDSDPAVTYDGIRRITADLADGPDRFAMTRVTDGQVPTPAPLDLSLSTGRDGDVANLNWAPGSEDSVWVDLGDGSDLFDARLIPPPEPEVPSVSVRVAVKGGDGDDDITARMGVEPTPFVPVVNFVVDIDGGNGNDAVAVNTQVDPGSLVGFNPQPEPPVLNFAIAVRGGAGLDRITSRMGIQPTPFLPPVVNYTLAMDGGSGDDVLDAQFEAGATQQKVADLHVALSGGDGNDSLRLTWTPGIAFDVDAIADGGAGNDVGVFSAGVRHVNVERLG